MFVWESLFPFTFKDNRNFTGYRIWGWHFFFFQYLKMSLLSSCLHGFWWEVCCSSYPSSSVGKVFHFPLAALKIFSLFSLSMICLGVFMGFCVCVCVCVCTYSVWCLLSVTDFGKFGPLFLPIFLLCCFFFFFWYFIYAHVILFGIVLSSWMFCYAFFILFLCVPVCLSYIAYFF